MIFILKYYVHYNESIKVIRLYNQCNTIQCSNTTLQVNFSIANLLKWRNLYRNTNIWSSVSVRDNSALTIKKIIGLLNHLLQELVKRCSAENCFWSWMHYLGFNNRLKFIDLTPETWFLNILNNICCLSWNEMYNKFFKILLEILWKSLWIHGTQICQAFEKNRINSLKVRPETIQNKEYPLLKHFYTKLLTFKKFWTKFRLPKHMWRHCNTAVV